VRFDVACTNAVIWRMQLQRAGLSKFIWFLLSVCVVCNCAVHKKCHDKVLGKCPGSAKESRETKVLYTGRAKKVASFVDRSVCIFPSCTRRVDERFWLFVVFYFAKGQWRELHCVRMKNAFPRTSS